MTTAELMHRLEQLGAAVAVCGGELAVEFDGELPDDLDAELGAHATDIIEALRLGPVPQTDTDAADRSPAGHVRHSREVLAFDVGPATASDHRPDRQVETMIADCHQSGVVFLLEGRTLTIDAPRGTLDDRRPETLAREVTGIAAAVRWLEQSDRRNLYRWALWLWVSRHADFLQGLPRFRTDTGQYVNRLNHARRLLAWERGDWLELFRFVDELEQFSARHNAPI